VPDDDHTAAGELGGGVSRLGVDACCTKVDDTCTSGSMPCTSALASRRIAAVRSR
jgi:hypothetical protein